MKQALMMPALVAALFTVACGDSPTAVATPAKVRFFSAVWNAPDGIGFTANSEFAAGSALAYSQSTQTCPEIEPGTTTFAIGIPNASGTALNSAALASLADQTIAEGGSYTVLAGGNVIHPSLILLDNSLTVALGANQAAVRFVNLAASSEFPFTVLKGPVGGGTTTMVQGNITFRGATPFSTVAAGSNEYTVMYNNTPVIAGTAATLDLQAGTVNTFVIVRNLADNFELVRVQGCS